MARRRTREEFIQRAREVHGDTYDYSKVEYVNSHTRVTITCRAHGDFTSTPGNHLSGSGCATCGGSERLTNEVFIERAREVHGDTYDYSKVEYVNNNKKIRIICSEHGEFGQGPADHWAGKGCPSCAGTVRLTTEQFIERAREVHGDTYDYSKVEYVNSHTRVTITCRAHGDFPQSPVNHWSGSGCQTCGTERTREKLSMTKEQFIELAREVHGDTYDYSKVEYVNTHTPVTITCRTHGDFTQSPAMHQSGQGCNACGIESAKRKMSMTQEQFIERSKEVHGDTYGYSKAEYVNSHTRVTITCRTHGDFPQQASIHLSGSGCPNCAGNLRRNTEEFIERAREVHGDTYDYSKVEYVNSHTRVTITCRAHGDFTSTPGNHLSGSGCKTCGGSERLTNEVFIERAREVHGDTYDYSKVEYVNNNKKVRIICSEHGEFGQGPADHWAGKGCPSCASSGYDQSKIGYLYVHALENREEDILCYKLGKSNDWKFRLEKQLKPHLAKYQREQQRFEGCRYRTIEVMRFADGAIPSVIESFVKKRDGKLAGLRYATIRHLDGGTEMFISNPLDELRESFPTMLESGVLVFPE